MDNYEPGVWLAIANLAELHRQAVTDQAALHGLLAKVHDPGLPLLEVRRIDLD